MSYAYWRKCDFQVHSPRDPNWTGIRPIGLGEVVEATGKPATVDDVHTQRAEWAEEFADQCVSKDLKAVAITDHHEMVMVPYVQNVIAQRINSDPNFDLWLFPGMELTAKGGKQCLIIFDADLPKEWIRQTQGRLGIPPYAGEDEQAAKSEKVTQLTKDYPDIANELDALEGLRGRYIVVRSRMIAHLPNE